MQSDAVPRGGKHHAGANGHHLAALVLPGHVVQHGRVIDEGVQFTEERREILSTRETRGRETRDRETRDTRDRETRESERPGRTHRRAGDRKSVV